MTEVPSPQLGPTAIRLAQRGLAVFPLAQGRKTPCPGSHGYLDASSDPDVAVDQWRRHPDTNIGIATGPISGLWVLDIDAHHDGDNSLDDLERQNGPLPVTVEATTPSGGRHLYFKWTDGIRNSASRVGVGIDVRGHGGYIVSPPSVLADGRRYTWVCSKTLASAPAWLIALTSPPAPPATTEPSSITGDVRRYVDAAVQSELRALAGAKEGRRNDQLNRTAFNLAQFVKAGELPGDWLQGALEHGAVEIGLSLWGARAMIASAFRAAPPRRLS